MKVRTKLNLILVLVILLVAFGGTVSVKDMEDVKDKALETMEASSRQSYDEFDQRAGGGGYFPVVGDQ